MGRLHPRAHLLDVHLANGHHHSSSSSSSTSTATATITTSASYFPTVIKPSPPAVRVHPPAREESTRVQLQRQRYKEQHAKTFVSAADIPGFQTSVAFFASLRTNLRLHASPPPSPLPTPNSLRGSTSSLPPPSPLAVSVPIMGSEVPDTPALEDPMAGVPALDSYIASTREERTEALMLVADSVAQQRQEANRSIIYHPLNVSTFIAFVAVVWRYMQSIGYDNAVILPTAFGLLMAALVSCRYWSQGYVAAAEKINWEWAGDVDILVTKFGEEVIAALLVEWVSGESRKKGKKAWRGVIKAWTTKLKYRGKGVGVALLEDAVKEAKKKGAESLDFADDHANSTRVLPRIYNGTMDKRERKARELLQDLLETSPVRGKRKS